jgi:ADP-ribose pyrophosphatase
MDADDVEVLERETGYSGAFRLEKVTLRHRRFDGGWTRPLDREIFDRGQAVAVVPYDPVRDQVVMIEQFRAGAFHAGWQPWMLEIVAGIIDEGEDALEVAVRETREEIGLAVAELEHIARFMPSPGAMSETVEMYVGRVDASAAAEAGGVAHEDEDIRVLVTPADEALALLSSGRIDTAITLVGLQWLALNRAALRARWLSADR